MADDLAQEALTKAWKSQASYSLGTNLKAWLFMILRNEFYSDRRRAWRQVPWDQAAAERRPIDASQLATLELSETLRALNQLQPVYREALILIAVGGFTCGEAAEICQCAEGTIKSRVFRARRQLAAIRDGEKRLDAPVSPRRDATRDLMSQLEFITSRIPSHRGGSAAGRAIASPV
jgi:RNA polymerase sigma-70 factor (ECF subfamily)